MATNSAPQNAPTPIGTKKNYLTPSLSFLRTKPPRRAWITNRESLHIQEFKVGKQFST